MSFPPQLYIYSETYPNYASVNSTETYSLYVPNSTLVPANSKVDIDMKLKMTLYRTDLSRKVIGVNVIPNTNINSTPLIMLNPNLSITLNDQTAENVVISVRNISNSDYTIPANTNLFDIMYRSFESIKVFIVDIDHIMINGS